MQGHDVTFSNFSDSLLSNFAKSGVYFDIIIMQKLHLALLYNDTVKNYSLFSGRPLSDIIIYQYDDIFFEMLIYAHVGALFHKLKIPFRLTLWINCIQSMMFIESHYSDIRYFFSYPPVYPDKIGVFLLDDRGNICSDYSILPYIKNIGRNIVNIDVLSDQLCPDRHERYHDKIVFFGQIGQFYQSPVMLSPKGYHDAYKDVHDLIQQNIIRVNGCENSTLFDMVHFNVTNLNWTYDLEDCSKLQVLSAYLAFLRQKVNRPRIILPIIKELGDEVVIHGRGWENYGFTGKEECEPLPIYGAAKACIDVGSIYLDTCLYQRSIEILAVGGNIVQKSQPDSSLIFGDSSRDFSFGLNDLNKENFIFNEIIIRSNQCGDNLKSSLRTWCDTAKDIVEKITSLQDTKVA
ncbi:hypothetical protein [Azospirillum doebereinerae]